MRIKPFRAVRPVPDLASSVASVPYDTVNVAEARALAGDNPSSFLHVIRAEIDFPDGADTCSDEVYARASANYRKLISDGVLVQDDTPSIYLYRQEMGEHVQRGIVCCLHIDDYMENRILRHEEVRPDKLVDRTRLTDTLNANSGPVFLTYRDDPVIDGMIAALEDEAPLYDCRAEDGIRHVIWRINDDAALLKRLSAIPRCYVADGHHRAASAVKLGSDRRKAAGEAAADLESDWFMAVMFPAGQLLILPYNRCVSDLNGYSVAEFMEETGKRFDVTEDCIAEPAERGLAGMYVDGQWHGLRLARAGTEEDSQLDVDLLQKKLLGPVLGIEDPRTDTRISFSGGIRGTGELERLVDSGMAAVAFSMYPVSIEQVMDIADAGAIMPPKSTWFEPKLRSGLLIHSLD